jgi:cytochrome c-type biogenesis protein CcmH
MILFWAICALMLVIALAFVLPPLLQRSAESERKIEDERKQANIAVYRDQLAELEVDLQNGIVSQEQYAQDRDEIERRLLEDVATGANSKQIPATAPAFAKVTAYALGIGLPLAAITFYAAVGNPKSITNTATASPWGNTTEPAPPERTQEQIKANVAKLAERLKSNPADAKGWVTLARSYSAMERYEEAVNAYAKATELTPNDADIWAEYAFATAMTNGRSLQGKPMELIDRALKVEPNNAKALQLAGSAAFEAKDYKKAVDYWERVLKQVPPNSDVGQAITSRINEAKSLAAGK